MTIRNKMLKLRIFGMLAETIGQSSMDIPHIVDTESLTTFLLEKYPQLKNVKFTLAVNKQLIHKNTLLQANAEIALLPPFSGG